jgi:hypothetical protein
LHDRQRSRRRPVFSVLVARADAVSAWVASFNRDVMIASDGFGSGPTRWAAVQPAAWQAKSVRKR